MLFESTKTLLRSIVQSLEKGDTSVWDDRLESGLQCQYELHQMSRSSTRAYKVGSVPMADRAIRAIPHVRSMTIAIRKRNQALALESGRMAIVELEEIVNRPRPVGAVVVAEPAKAEAPAPKPEPVKVAVVVKATVRPPAKPAPKKPAVKAATRHRKPAQRERRPAVGKRKAARALAAGK
jgi:hypothetical protein